MLPIREIAKKLALPESHYESIGTYGAKVRLSLLDDPAFPVRGKLILVTATTPTVSGEGKTVVATGLTQGLQFIGKSAILTSREPSLRTRLWLEGRSGRRRSIASGTKPENQSSFSWRLPRDYFRTQSFFGDARCAYVSWQRTRS